MSYTSKPNENFLHLPVFPVNPDQLSLPGRDPNLDAKTGSGAGSTAGPCRPATSRN